MKKTFLAMSLTMVCAATSLSQEAATQTSMRGESESTVSVAKPKQIEIQSGTRLEAQLQNSLDVRKAKVGDEVVLKTKEAIKSEGRVLVNKGAFLVGHVTSVAQMTKASGESRIGVVFDRLKSGSLEVPISATITSIARAGGNTRVGNDDPFATTSGQSNTSVHSNTSTQSSGGLLGGATNATIGTVNTVAGVASSTAAGTVSTVTNTGLAAEGTGQSLGRLRIIESSEGSAEASSTLSLQGENLRLEKGTTLRVVINQSAEGGAREKQ